MATIKGQNLRVAITESGSTQKYIAMATSCTLHIATDIQDKSTKDTIDGYADNEVVGLSWDVQTDALVCQAEGGSFAVTCNTQLGVGDFSDYYIYPTPIHMLNGDVLDTSESENDVFVFDAEGDLLANHESYTLPVLDREKDVYVGVADENGTADYTLTDSSGANLITLQDLITSKEEVTLAFNKTGSGEGKNRWNADNLITGTAIITDLSVNAQNRQDSTLSVTFTGTGELTMS